MRCDHETLVHDSRCCGFGGSGSRSGKVRQMIAVYNAGREETLTFDIRRSSSEILSLTRYTASSANLTCEPNPYWIPSDCSASRFNGQLGDVYDACGVQYRVYCGYQSAANAFVASHFEVGTLAACMQLCDEEPTCAAAMLVGQTCYLNAETAVMPSPGNPDFAAMVKLGGLAGSNTPSSTTPPRELRRAALVASTSTFNVGQMEPTHGSDDPAGCSRFHS